MASLTTDGEPVDAVEPRTESERVRVLIVDDERLMRSGLRLMIDGAANIDIVGEESDGAGVVSAVRLLAPDVVLMDIRMPGVDGIEATQALTNSGVPVAVVVLTAFDTDDFLLDALRAGAVSFLLKDAPVGEVIEAVRSAANGQPRFSATTLQRLVLLASSDTDHRTGPEPSPVNSHRGWLADGPGGRLTEREIEVAGLVAQGLTNSEIADALHLSLPTIKSHLGRLFDKLHATNRVQIAIWMIERQDKAAANPLTNARSRDQA